MATGKNGTFDLTMDNSFVVRIAWSEVYDAIANMSILNSIRAYLYSDTWTGSWYPQGTISVDGKVVVTMSYATPASHKTNGSIYKKYAEIIKYGNGAAPPWTSGNIPHNTDGSKSTIITVDLEVYNADTNVIRDLGKYSKTIALTNIPRASTIGATDADIGSNSAVVISKKSSEYTHSIRYEFGELSGFLTAEGGLSTEEVKFSDSSVAFYIPNVFYGQIPNSKTGVCKLTCTTYSGSIRIGEAKTAEFVVTAKESICKPSVTGTVIDSNPNTVALTGDASLLIKYFSTAKCTIEATAKNSAQLTEKLIAGKSIPISESVSTIAAVETGSISMAAVDSRGYKTTIVVEKPLINYVKLTTNAQLNRIDPTSGEAVLKIHGNYFNSLFGVAENRLSVWYRIAKSGEGYGNWIQVPVTIADNSYRVNLPLTELDYRYQYSAEIRCEDKLMSNTVTVSVSKGIPIVDWGEGDFRFNVPFLLPESMYGSSLPTSGKRGQLFFLLNSDGIYTIHIHNGTSWQN